MSNLPKRVQRELDAANAAEAEYQKSRSEAAAQAVPVSPATPPAAETPPVVVPTVTPPVVAAVPPVAKPEDFEHKFRVLQGMYEADVTRTKREVATLSAEIAALKTAPAAPASAQPVEADIEKFGADLIAMVQRYAEGQQAKTDSRLAALEQKVGLVVQDAAASRSLSFIERLKAAVPDFDRKNADPRWLAHMGETDPVFGLTYQQAVNDAQANGDAQRIANMFAAWELTLAPAATQPSLQELIVPQGSGSAPPTPATHKPILSEKSVLGFYNEVGRGLWIGRDKEMKAMELEIDTAVAEGRVR